MRAKGMVDVNNQQLSRQAFLCFLHRRRRFHGPLGAEAAAVAIQSAFRGHAARRLTSLCREQEAAGRAIQLAWRASRLRSQLLQRVQQVRRCRALSQCLMASARSSTHRLELRHMCHSRLKGGQSDASSGRAATSCYALRLQLLQ